MSIASFIAPHTWTYAIAHNEDGGERSPLAFAEERLLPLLQTAYTATLEGLAATPPSGWRKSNNMCDEIVYELAVPLPRSDDALARHALMLALNACVNQESYARRVLARHPERLAGHEDHPLLAPDTPQDAESGAYLSHDAENGGLTLHLLHKNPAAFYDADGKPDITAVWHSFQGAMDGWMSGLAHALENPVAWSAGRRDSWPSEFQTHLRARAAHAKKVLLPQLASGNGTRILHPGPPRNCLPADAPVPDAHMEGRLRPADESQQIQLLSLGGSPVELAIARHDKKALHGHLKDPAVLRQLAASPAILATACAYGTPEIIVTLLQHLPEEALQARSSLQVRRLLSRGLMETAQLLTEKGWRIDAKDFASVCHELDETRIVKSLEFLDCGMLSAHPGALCETARRGLEKAVRAMVSKGWSLSVTDPDYHYPPLYAAVTSSCGSLSQKRNTINAMIELGADLRDCAQTPPDGPCQHACHWLIDRGDLPCFPDKPGAADEVVYSLPVARGNVSHGFLTRYSEYSERIKKEKPSSLSLTPLSHLMLEWPGIDTDKLNEYEDLAEKLILNMQNPVLVNPTSPETLPPLHAAIMNRVFHPQGMDEGAQSRVALDKAIGTMLAHGADPNRSWMDVTPLYLAASTRYFPFSGLLDLIDHGADFRTCGKGSPIEIFAHYGETRPLITTPGSKWCEDQRLVSNLMQYYAQSAEGRAALRREWNYPPSSAHPAEEVSVESISAEKKSARIA